MTDYTHPLTRLITEAREARGYTVATLADRLGVTRQTMHYWQNAIKPLSERAIEGLSEALDLTPDQLYAAARQLPPDIEEDIISYGSPDLYRTIRSTIAEWVTGQINGEMDTTL